MKHLIYALFCMPFFCVAMKEQIDNISSLKVLAAAVYAKKYSIPENYQNVLPLDVHPVLSKAFFAEKVLPTMSGCVVRYPDTSNNQKSLCKIIDTRKPIANALCVIPDKKNRFVFGRVCAAQKQIHIFDATQQETMHSFATRLRGIFGLLAQQDNVIASGIDGLEIWDIKEPKGKSFIKTEALHSMCAFGDKHTIAGIDRTKDALFVYDLRVKDRLQHTIKINQSGGHVVRKVGEHILATGGNDTTVKFWDVRKCSKEECLPIQTYGTPIDISQSKGVQSFCVVDNKKVAAMHYNNMLSIWNINTGKREYFIKVANRIESGSVGGLRALNDRFIVFPIKLYRTPFQVKNPAVQVFDVTTGGAVVHCEQKIANICTQDECTILHNNMFTTLGQKITLHSHSWTVQTGNFAQLVQWDFTKLVDAYSGKYPLDKMQTLLDKADNKKEPVATSFFDKSY